MHFILIFFLFFAFTSFKMADRLMDGKKGDYIVSEQDRNYCLLFIKDVQKDSILFEEISVPTHLVDLSSIRWKEWLQKGALGHTSWVQYEIDATSFQLIEGYSFSKKGWLYLSESEQFLSQLLTLSLQEIPKEERKKIGPAPLAGEPDNRKTWTPPFFNEGEKIKAACEAWKTKWPQDSTLLSGCQMTLYFPPKELSIFPSWIEANNGHFNFSIKIVDSGKNIVSPLNRTLPHRPPQILKNMQQSEHEVLLPIKASPYYKSFSLFTSDMTNPEKKIGPISFTVQKEKNTGLTFLHISKKNLSSFLEENHRYKWILLPQGPEGFVIESEDFFRWNP